MAQTNSYYRLATLHIHQLILEVWEEEEEARFFFFLFQDDILIK